MKLGASHLTQANFARLRSADITPSYVNEDDMRHFHGTYKKVCDNHDEEFYPKFKEWADRYFVISHRNETRGLGGIFFDDLNDRPADTIFEFSKEVSGFESPRLSQVHEAAARKGVSYDGGDSNTTGVY